MPWEAIGSHLSAWDHEKAIQAARDVEDLLQHPGFAAVLESAALYEHDLQSVLMNSKPSDNAAEYATKIGEMKGLRQLEPLARGVLAHGKVAAQRLRELQNQPTEEVA